MTTMMRYDLPLPKERNPEPPQRDSKLEEALKQYHLFCADFAEKEDEWVPEDFYTDARDRITAVLNSLYINRFLAEITRGKEDTVVKSGAVNVLINNAYAAGIHSFDINIPPNLETYLFGAYLCGTKEHPLNLRITGNLGRNSFCESEHVNAILEGDCGHSTAYRARSMLLESERLQVADGFPYALGFEAKDSVFRFHHLNDAIVSRNSPSSPWMMIDASNCTIQVYTVHDFELIKQLSIHTGRNHKIQLIKKGTNAVIDEVSV